MNRRSFTLKVATGIALPAEPPLHLAADIFLPEHIGENPIALICLPGGGMNRRYFDLRPADAPDAAARDSEAGDARVHAPTPAPTLRDTVSSAHGDNSFSFAAQMTARGFLVITLDYPGIGDSDRPADGYALTHEVVTQACVHATEHILDGLRSGSLLGGIAAMPALRSVGVGHSMGGMFTVLTQALRRQHEAIAVLGFSTRGLPEYVPAHVRELAIDPAALRAQLVALAKAQFVESYPVVKPSPQSAGIYAGANAESRAVAALKVATGPLLPVPAYLSMVPGNVAPEAAEIDVPVFIGLGERDMAGPPHDVPRAFPRSRDLSLHILPGAGHSHFLFPSRMGLFERLAHWVR